MKKSFLAIAALCLTGVAAAQTGTIINGVTWAATNVGEPGSFVAGPEDFGNYYTFKQAQRACPAGWRVPTQEEIISLTASETRWTTVAGVAGVQFGSGGNTIFLPAAGRQRTNPRRSAIYVGTHSFYWTSTKVGTGSAHDLLFYEEFRGDPPYGGATRRHNHLSVRCVKE